MVESNSGQYRLLSDAAWLVRKNARLYGPTAVGCAALSDDGRIFVGCNLEHRFRSHDIHAEVNALSSLVASGADSVTILLIAAERDRFTPCGSCLDWVFEIGGEGCLVLNERIPGRIDHRYLVGELMPFYPS
ncbi:cytidine deaminase family protein [Actinomadura madurae]|uniref:cytidine deaminase family protein n=1 Tax=Actinomadura madurae TaxID=1993 RepID=UPI003557C06A